MALDFVLESGQIRLYGRQRTQLCLQTGERACESLDAGIYGRSGVPGGVHQLLLRLGDAAVQCDDRRVGWIFAQRAQLAGPALHELHQVVVEELDGSVHLLSG